MNEPPRKWNPPPSAFPPAREWAALLLILALWVAVRLPWSGHLLSWDEAMNLLSCRADFRHEIGQFADWRLRYPPLHDGLLLLLDPAADGFALRAEALSLVFSALALLFVFLLNRFVFGPAPALWAAAALALMPAAIFFDRWIKQDVPLSAISYLALACVIGRRYWAAGILMGFAFLCKHMAGYFVAAIGLLLLPLFPRRAFWGAASALAAGTLAVGGWWYLGQLKDFAWFMSFAVGGMNSNDWVKPMNYYAVQAPVDLGWAGLACGVIGLAAIARRARERAGAKEWLPAVHALWPLALLVPALVAIHLSHGKTPWYTIVLYPAAATLVGLGAHAIACGINHAAGRAGIRARWTGAAAASALLLGNFAVSLCGVSYDQFFARKDRLLMLANRHSKEAGELVRRQLRQTGGRPEPYAASDMAFWALEPGHLCAVFALYADHQPSLILPSTIGPEALVDLCRSRGIDLAFFSVAPGLAREKFIGSVRALCPDAEFWPTPAGVVVRFGGAGPDGEG